MRLWWVDIHSFPNSKPIASYRLKVNHILGGQDGVLAFFPTTSSIKLLEASAIPFISNGTKTTEYLLLIERETRFELATYSLEGCRSTNWATPAIHKINPGPTSRSKHGRALFKVYFERETRFELATLTLARSCSTDWATLAWSVVEDIIPVVTTRLIHFCVPSWIRTMDHLVNSQVLYHWAKKT